MREEIESGFESALSPFAVDVDADAELEIHEAFFEAKTLQLAKTNAGIGVEYLISDGENFGDRPKILIRQFRKNRKQNFIR